MSNMLRTRGKTITLTDENVTDICNGVDLLVEVLQAKREYKHGGLGKALKKIAKSLPNCECAEHTYETLLEVPPSGIDY